MEQHEAFIDCECTDPGCPACHGECENAGTITLHRIDMQDKTGTMFCSDCADDAMESGVFTTKSDDDFFDEE